MTNKTRQNIVSAVTGLISASTYIYFQDKGNRHRFKKATKKTSKNLHNISNIL